MATIHNRPYPLNVEFYPSAKASITIVKSGFPEGALLTQKTYLGTGAALSDLAPGLQPEVINGGGRVSQIVWTAAKTKEYNQADYTFQLFIDDEIVTLGYAKQSYLTSETDPDEETFVIEWKGNQNIIVKPLSANDPILIPYSEGIPLTDNEGSFLAFNHKLSCEACWGRIFNATGGEIENARLIPLTSDAARSRRDWAYVDSGGADLTTAGFVGVYPLYL